MRYDARRADGCSNGRRDDRCDHDEGDQLANRIEPERWPEESAEQDRRDDRARQVGDVGGEDPGERPMRQVGDGVRSDGGEGETRSSR